MVLGRLSSKPILIIKDNGLRGNDDFEGAVFLIIPIPYLFLYRISLYIIQ